MSSPHTQKPSGASEPSDREKPEQQKGDKAHERRMYVRFGLMIRHLHGGDVRLDVLQRLRL